MYTKPALDIDSLVAELATEGISVSKEEAQLAVERLAELLLLISAPLPLPSPPLPSTKVETKLPRPNA